MWWRTRSHIFASLPYHVLGLSRSPRTVLPYSLSACNIQGVIAVLYVPHAFKKCLLSDIHRCPFLQLARLPFHICEGVEGKHSFTKISFDVKVSKSFYRSDDIPWRQLYVKPIEPLLILPYLLVARFCRSVLSSLQLSHENLEFV